MVTMRQEEWKEKTRKFDLQQFLSQDTSDIYENAAVLVITNQQLIIGKTARDGEQPHSDAFEDIYETIYDIDWSHFPNSNRSVRSAIIKDLYGSDNITARLLNERQNRLVWFSFPPEISSNQLELLAAWCHQNNEIIDDVEKNIKQQFVGLMQVKNKVARIGNLDTVLEYAKTIVSNQAEISTTKPEQIIGITLTDFAKVPHL